ncbi:MAG: 2-hydroxychromene-2-carboxylate isomerase [Bradymonadia bacterium]|jgi:2-hydroxychromene-2-carboxylate isomerase
MVDPAPIRFLFDYISPYAFIAWRRIHALALAHGRTVEAVPILFAGCLKAHGHKGPAQIPSKRIYVFKDCLRTAAVEGIELHPPPSHPFNPLLALRVTGLDMPEATRRALIDRLFDEVWTNGRGVEDPSVIAEHCAAVGLKNAVERAAQPEAKLRLRTATEAAIAAGAFGVPTIMVGDELFWGFDSYPHLARYLAGADPLPADRFAAWHALYGS